MKLTTLFLGVATFFVCACGPNFQPTEQTGVTSLSVADAFVVKSQALYEISTTDVLKVNAGNPATIPISVINTPDVSMTVDSSKLIVPTLSAAKLDFGIVRIKDLRDNDLKVCGSDGHSRCTKALIRIYTTGTAGAGLYNESGGYGLPISTSLVSASEQTVGLGSAQAANVQTFDLPLKKNVLQASDFPEKPEYQILVDFSDAGAGTFATTLVVEYGLQ